MSSVMMCVSITDPLASPDNQEWKKHVIFFLNELKDSYSEYLKSIEKSSDETKFYKISLVLVCIKLALVRALPVFPSYEQNVSFFYLKQKIENVLDEIIDYKHINAEVILPKLHDIENCFSAMMASISPVTDPTLGKTHILLNEQDHTHTDNNDATGNSK